MEYYSPLERYKKIYNMDEIWVHYNKGHKMTHIL